MVDAILSMRFSHISLRIYNFKCNIYYNACNHSFDSDKLDKTMDFRDGRTICYIFRCNDLFLS